MAAVIAEGRCPFIHFHICEGEDTNIHNIYVSYQAHSTFLSESMKLLARKEHWLSGHTTAIFTASLTSLLTALRVKALYSKLLCDPVLQLMGVKNFKTF